VILNRRLGRLRDGRADMERLVGELTAAMTNAERGIAVLRKTAFDDDEALGKRIAEARAVRDEIGFLVDRAETLSARLDGQIGAARAGARPSTRGAASGPPPAASDDDVLFAAGPTQVRTDDAADVDGDVARAARATATAWLRNRGTARVLR
jgi:hypothetical protein